LHPQPQWHNRIDVPDLPDLTVYIDGLRARIVGQTLRRVRLSSPFVLRSVDPPLHEVEGQTVNDIRRLGKRIVLCFPNELFLVFHLMIAGRFRWEKAGAKGPGRICLAAFDFAPGTLLLTEASPKKRAALHVVRGEAQLAAHDPGGIDVLTADLAVFRTRLLSGNHTLKRALTDPRSFSGIGNAYSDEILHAARLSPVMLTSKLDDIQIERLFDATRGTLATWTTRLLEIFRDRFPGAGDITAFRPDFAAHGRFGQPCPVCASKVQRIRYADNETNYCPRCQTGGKLLADRSLSRLLKSDWPKSIDEWEEQRASHAPAQSKASRPPV